MFFPSLPKGDAHWVYDDPSGVPETPAPAPAPAQVAKPKQGKVIRFPVSAPATPKAA
jgi:hypothetical protein